MNIRAYEGYNQPFGADLLSILQSESEKLLSSLTQPSAPQIQTITPTQQTTDIIPQTRALPTATQTAQTPTAGALSPIAILVMLYLAWHFLGKK